MIDAVTAARVRALEPIRRLSPERQSALLAAGEVLEIEAEAWICPPGEGGDQAYFLLEGELAFVEGSAVVERLSAERPEALRPLHGPDARTGGIIALSRVRVFRIAFEALDGAGPAVAEPPAPPAAYADTLSGEQLAALVERIAANRQALAEQVAPPAGRADDDRLERTSYTVDLGAVLGESTLARPEPARGSPASERVPPPRDRLGQVCADLEARLRIHVENVRAAERRAYDARLARRMAQLRERAVAELKRKLVKLRSRDRELLAEKERTLRERYAELARLTHRITHQKAQLKQARRQLEEKLHAAEEIHHELARIGQSVTRQLEDLDGLMAPDGESGSDTP